MCTPFFSLTMYYSFGRTVECYFMVVQSLCSYKYHNNDIYHANLLNTFISGLKDQHQKYLTHIVHRVTSLGTPDLPVCIYFSDLQRTNITFS